MFSDYDKAARYHIERQLKLLGLLEISVSFHTCPVVLKQLCIVDSGY